MSPNRVRVQNILLRSRVSSCAHLQCMEKIQQDNKVCRYTERQREDTEVDVGE